MFRLYPKHGPMIAETQIEHQESEFPRSGRIVVDSAVSLVQETVDFCV